MKTGFPESSARARRSRCFDALRSLHEKLDEAKERQLIGRFIDGIEKA